jgi:hypothetical protein
MKNSADRIIVENADVCIAFAADTGRLESLYAHPHGREYLDRNVHDGPFSIWHGFAEPYVFSREQDGTACTVPPEPSDIAAGRFLPGELSEAVVRGDRCVLRYREPGSALIAVVTVELDGPSSRWTLTVTNEGTAACEMMADFPRWQGLNLAREADGRMLVMNQAGYVGSLWSHRGGLYGHSFQQSAQFGCLFEKATRDCFGFYVDDSTFGAKEIRFVEPGIEIRWFPPVVLAPGESHTYPSSVLMLYDGLWKETARAYGDWYEAAVGPDPVPAWVRHNDTYAGAWMERRGDEYDTRPGPSLEDMPLNAMESFDELPIHYLRMPTETIEFAFYCRQSQWLAQGADGQPLGPQPRRHTDGWNAIREDLGGLPALVRGVEAVHRMGRKVTLYVEGLIVPDDSELFEHIPAARDWVVLNADGTTDGPYTVQRFVHMCPGCLEWQDHVVDMCRRLTRDTGIDGIRLDSLGFYFWPCHNPAHGHASPYDYNAWVQELYEKVARAVRAIRPDALLSTEAPADLNHRHFNHSLHQIASMELPEALEEDVSPLRVALPKYRLHTGAAVAGPSMQMQPLWQAPGEDDAPWIAAFSAARPTLSDGDASLPDPIADPAGMRCRRVRGETDDVVVGVRSDWSDGPTVSHRLLFRGDRVKSRITLPLEYRPAAAWLFDLEARTLEPLSPDYDDGVLGFTTESNWFMALLQQQDTQLSPCWINMPQRVKHGSEVVLNLEAPGVSDPANAVLRIPGMAGRDSIEVRVPGTVSVQVPADTQPGWYRAELSSDQLLPTVCMFRVTR